MSKLRKWHRVAIILLIVSSLIGTWYLFFDKAPLSSLITQSSPTAALLIRVTGLDVAVSRYELYRLRAKCADWKNRLKSASFETSEKVLLEVMDDPVICRIHGTLMAKPVLRQLIEAL